MLWNYSDADAKWTKHAGWAVKNHETTLAASY